MKVSGDKAADALRKKAREIEQRIRAAELATAQEALQVTRAYSSGPFSTRQLRILGHPYARRAPRPPMTPAIINRQTGRFLRAWKVRPPRKSEDRLITKITNDTPYASGFTPAGTALMIGRPIVRAVKAKVLPHRIRRLRAALRAGLDAR